MTFEMWAGLDVGDEAGYAAYRAEMTPILGRFGGSFVHDFAVARTLKSEAPHPINRVFAIRFPDAAARGRFFADPGYLKVKERHFAGAVRSVAILGEYGS